MKKLKSKLTVLGLVAVSFNVINDFVRKYLQRDQQLEQQQALKNLNQVVTREAQVRAYNDVISFNGIVAMLLLLWGTFLIARNQYQLRQQAKIGPA